MTATIKHYTVYLSQQHVSPVLHALAEQGICQVNKHKESLSEMYASLQALSSFSVRVAALEPHFSEKGGSLWSYFTRQEKPKIQVKRTSTSDFITQAETILGKIEQQLNPLKERQEQIDLSVQSLDAELSTLASLPSMQLSLLQNGPYISVMTGIINQEQELSLPHSLPYFSHSLDKKRLFIAVPYLPKQMSIVKSQLEAVHFIPLSVPLSSLQKDDLVKEKTGLRSTLLSEKLVLQEKVAAIVQNQYPAFYVVKEEIAAHLLTTQALQHLHFEKAFAVVDAWVPGTHEHTFVALVTKITHGAYYAECEEKEEAPTLLENQEYVKPFELLTRLYALPKYKHFDPTIILSLSFVLFFGFMVSDVFYGTAIMLIAFGLYSGMGNEDKEIKDFAFILMTGGFIAIILGVFFGSYFGNFFNTIGITVPSFLDPMRDILPMVTITVGMGALHLLIGLVMGFREHLLHDGLRAACEQQGVWIFFLLGGLAGFIHLKWLCIVLVGAAVLMQVVFNALSNGAIISALSLFSFFGFIGDLFSYARLMALALGGSGIALAVNFMALLAIQQIPYVGYLVGFIIFVVGHTFNLSMNVLGGIVHALRLHFLEFFSKFYSGGGIAYEPFSIQRKKTEVIE